MTIRLEILHCLTGNAFKVTSAVDEHIYLKYYLMLLLKHFYVIHIYDIKMIIEQRSVVLWIY